MFYAWVNVIKDNRFTDEKKCVQFVFGDDIKESVPIDIDFDEIFNEKSS